MRSLQLTIYVDITGKLVGAIEIFILNFGHVYHDERVIHYFPSFIYVPRIQYISFFLVLLNIEFN